jgi:hypothetical protein
MQSLCLSLAVTMLHAGVWMQPAKAVVFDNAGRDRERQVLGRPPSAPGV